MTPEELAAHLKDATGAVVRDEIAHGHLAISVPPERWRETAEHLRRCGRCHFEFLHFLSAVDREEEGFEAVLHLYSVRREQHVRLKTALPRERPVLPTLSDLWRGANWHERETFELFGIEFDGHPNLAKLLLPEVFEGHPLRKDFLLMTREAKEWPGLKEPEEKRA